MAFASMFLCVVVCLRSLRERTMRQMRVFFCRLFLQLFYLAGERPVSRSSAFDDVAMKDAHHTRHVSRLLRRTSS